MTAPCDPEAAPEPREEEHEIVLRLGDILPRVPSHLLKPGPHDPNAQLRFTVDELAEKISRGRVTVPLRRLSAGCPGVFRDNSAFLSEQEVPLPLQKLLAQIGLAAPKPPSTGGVPGEQVAQARAEASRIMGTNAPLRPISSAENASPPPSSSPIAKAISTARNLFGLFGVSNDSAAPAAGPEKAAEVAPIATSQQPPPPASDTSEPKPSPVQTAPPVQSPPEPEIQPVPEGCISLHVLPIFRLLSARILKSAPPPSEDARLAVPLAAIDPQLAGGHVEIPINEFVKALPEGLRLLINPIPDAKVWIPLDEIFQNLPPDHLFYMPPLDPLAPPHAVPPMDEPVPAEPVPDIVEDKVEPVPPPSPEPPQTKDTRPVTESTPEPQPAPPTPPPSIPEAVTEEPMPDPVEIVSAPEPAPIPEVVPPIEAKPLEPSPPAAEPAPPPVEPPPLSRAPWMHGVQIPPPRLFAAATAPIEAPLEPATTEPSPPTPATPEAKRTVDFLASHTGIFAAAAFIEGAVFTSADFPGKPDLDTLRDFIEHTRESGQRLGWNGVLTVPCEQFHLTAVVRDTGFIVALHHDRILAPITYDSLISATDDLRKSA